MSSLNCQFKIIVDTREKAPWHFQGLTKRHNKIQKQLLIEKVIKKLPAGDYSILGSETDIAIERKSCQDLVSTIFHGRSRFLKELERLQNYRFSAVVVEATWQDVLMYCKAKTEANPVSLDSSILAFMERFIKTHWIFRPTRFSAMKTAYKLFDRYYQDCRKEEKNARKSMARISE